MQNKIKRALLTEAQFHSRMALAVLLVISIFMLKGFVAASKKTHRAAQEERKLVLEIPIMEKLIEAKTPVNKVRAVEAVEGPISLEGTYVKSGVTYALINGTILSIGDMYGDYEIVHIEFGVAILDNKKTKERKILQFFYYE
jgi:hypothetical protein